MTRILNPLLRLALLAPALAGAGISAAALAGSAGAASPAHLTQYAAQTTRPLSDQDWARLQRLGITLERHAGGGWVVITHAEPLPEPDSLRAAGLSVVGPMAGSAKLHSTLHGGAPAWARFQCDADEASGEAAVDVMAMNVLLRRSTPFDEAAAMIQRLGGGVISTMTTVHGLHIWLPTAQLEALSLDPSVVWIEPALPRMSAMNAENRELTQAQLVQAPPYGLDGEGVVVMVYDVAGADETHPDFGGRLTVHDQVDLIPFDHPTHVSGTIGGDGSQSGGLYRGMAPAVHIESYAFLVKLPGPGPPNTLDLLQIFTTNPGDIEQDYLQAATEFGAVLANNSIGLNLTLFSSTPEACPWYGEYSVMDGVIDSLARGDEGPPMIICWAAGNPRHVEPDPAACDVEYGSISPPSNAKNSIVIGAVNADTDMVTHFTAFGPTKDGRTKPDLCAPGCQVRGDQGVTSTEVGVGYLSACGTSMATPTATGLIALMLQDHRLRHPGQGDFANATAKAVLAQTAADIEFAGPDFRSGYGSVRVREAVDLMRDDRHVEESIEQAQLQSYKVAVSPGQRQLKVTIAWDDPPGMPTLSPLPSLQPRLVNDLDLALISPSKTVEFPWTLDPANPEAPAVRTKVDRLNNLEQVQVDNPEPGMWIMEVRGFAVQQGPQAYALAASLPFKARGPSESADLNGDGVVNGFDLAMLLAAWGACPPKACPADLNRDGVVNGFDLGILLAAWG